MAVNVRMATKRLLSAALTAAWMTVIGSGSQRIYAVLQVPIWAWLVGAAVAPGLPGAGRVVAVLLALLVFVPGQLSAEDLPTWDGRAIVLLGAWLAWSGVALRTVVHGWRTWSVWRRVWVPGLLVWLAGLVGWWSGLGLEGWS